MNKELEVVPPEKSFLAPVEVNTMDIATTRSAQEVQAAMVIAKKFPRNETVAISRIMQACDRLSLAEGALYAFPRKGTTVTGPSIRLAEALARAWGNMDFGLIELEQKDGESSMMACAWDLETNARSTKIFTVKHVREKRDGNVKLDDPRDVYEITANMGSRRLRACILSLIPGDVVEMAVERCEQTLKNGDKAPMTERVAKVVSYLAGVGVNVEMIEKRLGHKIDAITPTELVTLRKYCKAIEDGMAKPEDFFQKLGAVESAPVKKPEASAVASVAAPKEEPPKANADPMIDRSKPHDSLFAIIKRDQVAESSVLEWAKKKKLAGAACPDVAGMSEANCLKLLDAWPNVVEDIKKL